MTLSLSWFVLKVVAGDCHIDPIEIQPNLQPPIRTVERALVYKSELQAIEPNVNYLMSLYVRHQTRGEALKQANTHEFHAELTPEIVAEAAKAGIAGIKVYPQGSSYHPCISGRRKTSDMQKV